MPQLSVHGVDVFFRDEGQGEPVILGHSSTGSSGQWHDLIMQLASGHRSLAPDHLGYGRTGAYTGRLPLIDHEIAVIEALLRLVDGPAHFVGHSFGGSVLARTAIRMPDRVKSLTLIEPILFYLLKEHGNLTAYAEIRAVADRAVRYVEAGNSEEAARGFINYWIGPHAYESMSDELQASVAKGMAKVRFEWGAAFDPRGATIAQLSALPFPIQLIAGAKTTAAAAGVTHLLKEIWPNARYAEIEGAGHMAPITHASLVNPIIEEFIGLQMKTGGGEK